MPSPKIRYIIQYSAYVCCVFFVACVVVWLLLMLGVVDSNPMYVFIGIHLKNTLLIFTILLLIYVYKYPIDTEVLCDEGRVRLRRVNAYKRVCIISAAFMVVALLSAIYYILIFNDPIFIRRVSFIAMFAAVIYFSSVEFRSALKNYRRYKDA